MHCGLDGYLATEELPKTERKREQFLTKDHLPIKWTLTANVSLTSKLFLLKHSMLRLWQRVMTNILSESAGREL